VTCSSWDGGQLAETAFGQLRTRRPGHRGRPVGGQVQKAVADAHRDQDLLVGEGGRLDRQPHAVGEAHQGGAQVGDLALAGGLGRGPEAGVGPLDVGGDHRSGDGGGARGFQRGGDGGLAALDGDRRGDEDQRAVATEGLVRGGVDLIDGDGGSDLAEAFQIVVGVGEDLVVVDRLDQTGGQGRGLARRGAGGDGGQGGAELGQFAIQLGLADAVLDQATLFLFGRLDGGLPGPGIEADRKAAGVEGVVKRLIAAARAEEGRVRLAGDIAEAAVQNGRGEAAHDRLAALGAVIGCVVMGHGPEDLGRRLSARLDVDDGFGLARLDMTQVRIGAVRGRIDPVAEAFLDLGLHRIDVEVADCDQGGALGPVVGFVEVDEPVAGSGPDDVQVADRQTIAQTLARGEEGEEDLQRAHARAVAGALLALDDAALAVDRVRGEQQFGGDFTQGEQAGVHHLVGGVGQVQHIGGLVETGLGVGVAPEGHPQPFQVLGHVALGDMGRTVEGHVFEEVGQALLVVAFRQGARVDAQTQGRLMRRGGVVQDGVAHAVGQDAEAHGGVGRKVAGRLGPGIGRRGGRRGGRCRSGQRIGGQGGAGQKGRAGGGEQQQAARGNHTGRSGRRLESPERSQPTGRTTHTGGPRSLKRFR
jgi:hypothetical protein